VTIGKRLTAADQRLLRQVTAGDGQAKQAISLVKRPKKLLVYRPQAGD
jgi:hypothetical protein